MGYLTLYVVKRTSVHVHDDPKLELILLQHADIYDEHTRTTTAHLQSCFPTAAVHYITFPKEQASDFTLLVAYAAACTSSAFQITDKLLADTRTAVLTYIELLELSLIHI